MNVKQLKEILAPMADDALVFARDRDCINLEMIDLVKHPTMPVGPRIDRIKNHETIETIYGGRDRPLDNPSGQAIIFCDCD